MELRYTLMYFNQGQEYKESTAHEQNSSIKGGTNLTTLCTHIMEAKRHRISALIDANISTQEITCLKCCSRALVAKVKRLKSNNQSLACKPGSGGHNLKRTEEFLLTVAAAVEADPTTSIHRLAQATGTSTATIWRTTKELGLVSYHHRRRQFLSNRSKELRVEKGRKLLAWVRDNPSTVQIFSDKKLWTVEQAHNPQNDQYLACCSNDVPPVMSQKHPASAMMLGAVTSDGKKMPLTNSCKITCVSPSSDRMKRPSVLVSSH